MSERPDYKISTDPDDIDNLKQRITQFKAELEKAKADSKRLEFLMESLQRSGLSKYATRESLDELMGEEEEDEIFEEEQP